jgi:hypothetical protein
MAMTKGLKIGIGASVLVLAAVGGEVGWLHHRNAEDAKVTVQKVEYKSDPDDMVFLKHEHPMSLKDEKDLIGKSIWVSAGGQLDYYPFNGHAVDYGHSESVLLGADKLLIKDAIEQVAPKKAAFRIPQGDKQVLLVFTRPNDTANPAKAYGVPVGYREGDTYTFLTDEIFFYEDPHESFKYWSPEIWKAIDEHRAIPGMNEKQVYMALGEISVPHGDKVGDRMVEFDNQGKTKLVTFVGGKATNVADGKQ